MKFPTRKNDVVQLALQVLNGLSANQSDFPDPPFVVANLGTAYSNMLVSLNERQSKEAELDIAITDEKEKLRTLKSELRKILTLAEAYHRSNPEKLSLIGWGPRAERESNPPAQPDELKAERLASGVVRLTWQAGIRTESTGPVRFYRVERREKIDNDWTEWSEDHTYSTTRTELTLYNQPEGVELEYRVIAVNVAGRSMPSNTAAIVA